MAKTKQPWFKAWVKDILADSELRSVPMAARGFWLYLMCLMHKSPRKGYLLQANGHPYSNEQLGDISGCSTEEAAHLHQLLITSAVFSVSEDGFVYSRRMVRESKLSEVRSVAGKKGVFAKQTRQQKPSNALEYGIEVNCSSFSEEEEKSIPPPDGMGVQGEGKFASAKKQQNEIDVPTALAHKFAFMRGMANNLAEIRRAAVVMTDLLAAGVTEKSIDDELDRKKRTKSEPSWDFQKRLMEAQKANGKATGNSEGFAAFVENARARTGGS